jgi:hypothetical protein
MRARNAERGQSIVEMSLGLIVFVTILLFGIYFAEVGFLIQKAQEATNWTVWRTTGMRMNEKTPMGFAFDPYLAAIAQAKTEGSQYLNDQLMGVQGYNQQVIARTAPVQVECASGADAVPHDDTVTLQDANDGAGFSPYADAPGFNESQALACNAGLEITPVGIPREFLEETFKVPHRQMTGALRLCAVGRPDADGNCGGRIAVLLDDWGLMGAAEGLDCPLDTDQVMTRSSGVGCANSAYWNLVHSGFKKTNALVARGNPYPSDGSALAEYVSGYSPVQEGSFFMSFIGYNTEHPYAEDLTGAHLGQDFWETTPWEHPTDSYKRAFGLRKGQFMGVDKWWN